jgi:hypothetical protein
MVSRVTSDVDQISEFLQTGGPFRVDSRWRPLVMLFLASKKGDRCR